MSRALDDLELIHAQIAVERPLAAARMKRRLEEAAEGLADFPEAGRAAAAIRLLVTVRSLRDPLSCAARRHRRCTRASWSQGALNVVLP